MNRLRARLPSPAMIVAIVALVVATAGTTYAAIKLPRNSVGTGQLKKNAVTKAKVKKDAITGAKVKKASLTGEDIDLATLGTVPSAQAAQTAQTSNVASSLTPLEPTHIVGAPGEPGFEGGAENLDDPEFPGPPFSLKPAGFYKDHSGIVHLQGMVQAGSEGAIFSLPPGYRPAAGTISYFIVACIGIPGAECAVDSGGADIPQALALILGSNTETMEGFGVHGQVETQDDAAISLDGITFRAES